MFVGRKDELNRLEELYSAAGNSLVVLYGRERIGKTALVKKFCEDKQAVAYYANDSISVLQNTLFCRALGVSEDMDVPTAVLTALGGDSESKKVLVIDEFQYLAEQEEFVGQLVGILRSFSGQATHGSLMIILVSSSVNWVENMMVGKLGPAARLISGYIKLGELSFSDIAVLLGKTPVPDCIFARAVLGGVPGYLEYWNDKKTAEQNLYDILLSKRSRFCDEAEHLLRRELRELSSYNVILHAMATGSMKLNDLYKRTGFSRAKISVYIKNLIAMDIVEKIFAYDESGHENLQKGLYRIKDAFIGFYYAFVFPCRGAFEEDRQRTVVAELFSEREAEFLRPYFADVCREFLELMSSYGKLEHQFLDFRTWYGKDGTIDIVAGDGKGHVLAACCSFEDSLSGVGSFEKMKELSASAGLEPSSYYLFSKEGFEDSLKEEAKDPRNRLTLIALGDL